MTDAPRPAVLDAPTVRYIAALARKAAAGTPRPRSHFDVAAGALVGFADVLDEMLAAPQTKETQS